MTGALVDCHTHTLPRRWLDLAERYGDSRWPVRREIDACSADLFVGGKHFRTVPHTCWNSAARIEQMDASGIGTQWLSVTPVMFSYWAPPRQAAEMARHVNDEIANMVRHAPHRFVGLASLPLGDTDLALEELERAVSELGLRGIEIGTNVAGRDLDSPDLLPVFQAVAELKVPVFIHPWDIRAADRLNRYNAMYTIGMPTETSYAALAMLQGNVLGAVPDLRVLLAHGAGALAWLLPRIDRGWAVWPDRRGTSTAPPGSAARRLWADSLAGDEANLQLVGHRIGWDHIVLGSDYPFPFGEQHVGDVVLGSSFEDSIKSMIVAANAMALLTGTPQEPATEGAK